MKPMRKGHCMKTGLLTRSSLTRWLLLSAAIASLLELLAYSQMEVDNCHKFLCMVVLPGYYLLSIVDSYVSVGGGGDFLAIIIDFTLAFILTSAVGLCGMQR